MIYMIYGAVLGLLALVIGAFAIVLFRVVEEGKQRGLIQRVVLGLLALAIGAFAIVPFSYVGQGTNSFIATFAAVSLPFALLAMGLSRSDPQAWWAFALLICAPITAMSLDIGLPDYSLGAIAMIIVTMVGAYFGAKGQRRPPKAPDEPPIV
jgi:hypothetical protein